MPEAKERIGARGLPTDWESAEEVMHWYLNDSVLPGQLEMEGV